MRRSWVRVPDGSLKHAAIQSAQTGLPMAEDSSYAASGVDIAAAQRSLRAVSQVISSTHGHEVLGGIGGFGALFEPDFAGLERPVLVSSIDGVGTKTKVAHMVGNYEVLGHDIVNHCVNDILCQGARPLFFLDYFGCSHMEPDVFEQVLRGAAAACLSVNCALVGGETAEMPGVYTDGEVDIVGCIVGVVDYDHRLPRSKPQPGDRLVGIASSGLHTNGYSLARRVLFEKGGMGVRDVIPGTETTLGDALLAPHECYFSAIFPLLSEFPTIYALAHITGGGIHDNLLRVVPGDMQAIVMRASWNPPPLFHFIRDTGDVSVDEMERVFNMGIGMVAVVEQESADAVVNAINAAGLHSAEIGKVQYGPHDVQLV